MAKNFTLSLHLSNMLCIKNSTPETASMSSFVYNKAKPLIYLMKSVNPDRYSINDCPRKRK
jgi:hypothetical protein